MASPAGQTNQRGLGLSGSIHEEAHLGLLNLSNPFLNALRLVSKYLLVQHVPPINHPVREKILPTVPSAPRFT